ncbi:MAG: glycosyltransferase family 9 protein [Nitrospira sp.]
MKRTIVILHPGALGDVLLAVPAIRNLGIRFPQHEILLVADATVSRLLHLCRLVDDWMSVEGRACAGLFGGSAHLSEELQSWLQRCDVVVAWTEDKDGALAALVQRWGVAEAHIHSPFSPRLRASHQRDRFLETIGQTEEEVSSAWTIEIPHDLVEQGRIYLESIGIMPDRPLALVHPGSGSMHKCLGPGKVALILQQLQRGEMCPLVLEGPADHDAVEAVLKLASKTPPVLRNLDLPLLAGILAGTVLYLGHDSGITHLAALLGVHTIAVFGPTDHARWAPIGDHVTILRGAPCVCPSWEAVKGCHEKPCLDVPIEKMLPALGPETRV